MTKRLLMGNEAFAHAALEAGAGFFAGYPGTPSSELIETVARMRSRGRAEGVHVEWSTNEKAALELAAAAAMSGTRAVFTCKQVGLNVASDALMSLNYVGVNGGLVLFVADDPGPISSQTEQDTRRFADFAKVPVFDPATPEQGFLMMKAAFDLSELYGTPVIVRPTTRICHASTFFDVQDNTQAGTLTVPYASSHVHYEFEQHRQAKLAEQAQLPAAKTQHVQPGEGFIQDPERWVIFPKRSYQAHGEINDRLEQISLDFSNHELFSQFNPIYKDGRKIDRDLTSMNDPRRKAAQSDSQDTVGIVASGDSASYALEALAMLTKEAHLANVEMPSYKFMQIGTPFPMPNRAIKRFFKGVSHVLVLEELDHVVEDGLLRVAGASFMSPTIHGRLTGEASGRGENSTEDALARIAAFLDSYADVSERPGGSVGYGAPSHSLHTMMDLVERATDPNAHYRYNGDLPARPPVLCAGCPHRGSFYAVKRALAKLGVPREDAIFCGDIGCYTLGNAEPLDAVDTCLCMGAGITMAQGFSAVSPGKKAIAFIGDSTFFASGMTGVVNAVYNNHDITICVLDNSTTAMTGMQPHPGTGATLMGTHSRPIAIDAFLKAVGIDEDALFYADPLNLEQAEVASQMALHCEGPSAIIFKSPCIWLQKSTKAAQVNPHKCTGCKKCIQEIGCPAITFDVNARGAKSARRGQAVISPSQCTGCNLCVQVCPFGAIKVFNEDEISLMSSVETLNPADPVAARAFGNGEMLRKNQKRQPHAADVSASVPVADNAAGETGIASTRTAAAAPAHDAAASADDVLADAETPSNEAQLREALQAEQSVLAASRNRNRADRPLKANPVPADAGTPGDEDPSLVSDDDIFAFFDNELFIDLDTEGAPAASDDADQDEGDAE